MNKMGAIPAHIHSRFVVRGRLNLHTVQSLMVNPRRSVARRGMVTRLSVASAHTHVGRWKWLIIIRVQEVCSSHVLANAVYEYHPGTRNSTSSSRLSPRVGHPLVSLPVGVELNSPACSFLLSGEKQRPCLTQNPNASPLAMKIAPHRKRH